MHLRSILLFAGMAALTAVAGVVGQAQKTADGDWPMYARDLAGTKFSPLKQINADNVSRLQPAWNLTLVEPRRTPNPGEPLRTPRTLRSLRLSSTA